MVIPCGLPHLPTTDRCLQLDLDGRRLPVATHLQLIQGLVIFLDPVKREVEKDVILYLSHHLPQQQIFQRMRSSHLREISYWGKQ